VRSPHGLERVLADAAWQRGHTPSSSSPTAPPSNGASRRPRPSASDPAIPAALAIRIHWHHTPPTALGPVAARRTRDARAAARLAPL